MRHAITFAAICTALAASPAMAREGQFLGLNLPVTPLSADQFEVVELRGAGARDVWCAAARYALENLGQKRGRIYIAVPRGPARSARGRKGVSFTRTAPAQPVQTGVQVTTRVAGAGLLVAHAIQFCRDNIIEPLDRF